MNKERTPCVVCLGFFDGVHRGHLALLEEAKKTAAEEHLRICVHTFDRTPGEKGPELTTLAEREKLLRDAGADEVAVSRFTEAMRHMSGEDFFRKIVLEKLHARHVICGDDHRFGYKGACGVRELRQMCADARVKLTVVPPVTLENGVRISSSAIRRALAEHDWALAEEMLGRELPEKSKESFRAS